MVVGLETHYHGPGFIWPNASDVVSVELITLELRFENPPNEYKLKSNYSGRSQTERSNELS